MPIKPENKNRYPSNWKEIRAGILERAGNKCEWCGVENHSMQPRLVRDYHGGGYVTKHIKIVLTIAHMDHTPENCEPDNLRALCQRCHLTYDARHHAASAKAERERKQGQLNLFE